MKNLSKISLIIFAILFVILSLVIMISLNTGPLKPRYTIFNYQNYGTSLLYDTLKKMGYKIEPGYQKITNDSSINDVHIIIEPNYMHMSEEDLQAIHQWVKRGGRLLYFNSNEYPETNLLEYFANNEEMLLEDDYGTYSGVLGYAFFANSELFVNENLMNDYETGEYIASLLASWDYNTIYINEYYHGFSNEPTLYKSLPIGIKVLYFQFIIIIILIISYFGKRFGKPVPYYEEIEREENEYLIALSNIYEKSGKGYAAYKIYFNDFIQKCIKHFDIRIDVDKENDAIIKCLQAWKENGLPKYEMFESIVQYANNSNSFNTKKHNEKQEFIHTIDKINRLSELIGREKTWNQIKVTH